MTEIDFKEGEVEQTRWTISRRSFAIRMTFLVLLTPLFVSPLFISLLLWSGMHVDALVQWVAALPFALFLTWVLGDFGIWTRNRLSEWVLTNRAIHILNMSDPDVALPLHTIKRINKWPLWSLVIRLQNGTAITLPIVPQPAQTRQQIHDMRNTNKGGPL